MVSFLLIEFKNIILNIKSCSSSRLLFILSISMSKASGKAEMPDVDAIDAIKMLLYKHPVYTLCFVCLALYGLSMMLFF